MNQQLSVKVETAFGIAKELKDPFMAIVIEELKEEVERLKGALEYFEGFHIRGKEDVHIQVIRDKAKEFLSPLVY